MELYELIKKSKPYHLTIQDILSLNIGDELDVVIFDRNFDEDIWSRFKECKSYNPTKLLEESHHKIIYKGDMNWDIKYNFGETVNKMVHLDLEKEPTNWKWYPLDPDGYVRINNDIVKTGEKIPIDHRPINKHWADFDVNTRVGWRGPIMLWEDLVNLKTNGYWEIDMNCKRRRFLMSMFILD